MKKPKSIIVFTGGGLAPALNPTLYGVIQRAREEGIKVIGGLYGWASLVGGAPHIDTTGLDIEVLKESGGTFLRTSRTNPFRSPDLIDVLKKRMNDGGIDAVVAIGGDDTLGAALRLREERGINIIGVPKTIDNDLSGTYWTPGYPSAAQTLIKYAKEIREDAAYALSRIFVIETLGMKSGWLAGSACAASADVIIPPERTAKLDDVLDAVEERYKANGSFATVVIAENSQFDKGVEGKGDDQADEFGHARTQYQGLALRDAIKERMNVTVKSVNPGNFYQTGRPIPIDRDVAIELGTHAVELLIEGKFGRMPSVIREGDGEFPGMSVGDVPLTDVVGPDKLRLVDGDLFDFAAYQAKPAFLDYLKPITARMDDPFPNIDHLRSVVLSADRT